MPNIYCINIADMDHDIYQLLRDGVSEERRIKADRFHFEDDSKRCICAELLLRYSLFQKVGQLAEIEISYNKFGKPFLSGIKGFSYNISHSGTWVAIGYGDGEVGIDIEKIQEMKGIADRYFSEEEKQYIQMVTGDEQNKRVTQIWTLKESYIKYLGIGLSTGLDSFSINAIEGVVTNQKGEIQRNLNIKSFVFDTDYYISVCSMDEEITIHEITLEDIIQLIIW